MFICRAWNENLIKLVPDRTKLLCMNDELGDILYAENQGIMYAKWVAFQLKHHSESRFLKYFSDTWMNQTGKDVVNCSQLITIHSALVDLLFLLIALW